MAEVIRKIGDLELEAIGHLNTEITMKNAWQLDSKCPHCKDDSEYYFYTCFEFDEPVGEDYLQSGGYICGNCGWGNAGAYPASELE